MTGYLAQPDEVGDLLNNYTVKNLQQASGESSRSASKGISAAVWIAVVAGIVIVVIAALMVRRRVGDEHRA